MKHRYYPILLLYFFQVACMPEEDLPIRHTGETPEYFIECYCQPGRPFALSATSVLPVSEDLQIDFSKEMKDHIAGKALFDQKNGNILYTLSPVPSLYTIMEARKNLKSAISILYSSILLRSITNRSQLRPPSLRQYLSIIAR